MSNDKPIDLFKGQKVAQAFAHLPVKNLGEGIQGSFSPIIGIRGKEWTLKYQGDVYPFKREDDGTKASYIDVIIVGNPDWISKIYYPPGEWDEDSAGAPLCSSVKGDSPDPGVPEPQSKLCVTCKHYGWTTLPTGRRGKECQDHKRLAVLLMPSLTKKMLGSPLLEPVYLKIPPASLNPLKRYGDMLFHQGFPYEAVLARISWAEGKNWEMHFEPQQALTDREAPRVLPLLDDPRTKRITGEVSMIREVKPAAAKEPTRFDTGIEAAFDDDVVAGNGVDRDGNNSVPDSEPDIIPPVKRGRGRPPKLVETRPAVEQDLEEVVEAEEAKPLPKTTASWNEEDDALDSNLHELLNQKIKNMLPK